MVFELRIWCRRFGRVGTWGGVKVHIFGLELLRHGSQDWR